MLQKTPLRLIIALAIVSAATGLGRQADRTAAQTVIQPPKAQIKTTDIVRGAVEVSFNHDTLVRAVATSLQQQDQLEKDPFIKSMIEVAAADTQSLSKTADEVMYRFGGGEYSATVPLYKADPNAEVVGVVNVQISRPNPETGKAQPTQHDDLRSFINDQMAKNVGDAALKAKMNVDKPAEATQKVLADAGQLANIEFDMTARRGVLVDERKAAQDAVAKTTQIVLAQLNPPVPDNSGFLMTPLGLCFVQC